LSVLKPSSNPDFTPQRSFKKGRESEGGDKGGEGEWEGKMIFQVNEE
jgi:hypothetical protein